MKLTNRIKIGLAVGATLLSLSVFVAAQPHGHGIGFGPNNNPSRVTPKPTPPDTTLVGRKGSITPTISRLRLLHSSGTRGKTRAPVGKLTWAS